MRGGPMLRINPGGVRRVEYRIDDEQQLVRQSWGITEFPDLVMALHSY